MRKNILIACAAMSAVLAVQNAMSATPPATSTPSLATITGGQLQGKITGDVVSFKAVPYAAPPVGALRWREPQPVKPWSGTREALAFGAPCAQANLEWNKSTAAKSSEDCLTLNVWAPVRRDKALPVMIFFPGGAYHGGSAQGSSEIEPSYDGGRLAARGVIVVTANYRLGMFGFLAHPELSAESPHHVSGNYALLDKIAALNWVKANIGKFGGDPTNVTMFGQSAGSYSVGFLMTSPLAKGLFTKAIGLSGTVADFRLGASELKPAETDGAKFVKGFGITDKNGIETLRKKSAAELFKLMMASQPLHAIEPRGPVVDGYVFLEQPSLAFKQGHEAQVPFIIGNTARDGDVDSMGVSGTPKAAATLADKSRPLAGTHKVAALGPEGIKQIETYYAPYTDLGRQAAKLYGDKSGIDPVDGDVITAFNTDVSFRCGAGVTAHWHARTAPTWRYQFSHGYEPLGGVHLWDMMYVFGWTQAPADQPRDAKLADQEQRYWVNFATNGDPNGPGLPIWSKSGPADAYMDFASDGAMAKAGLRTAACNIYAQKVERGLTAMMAARKTP
jgi:para-nitrobenzyl esterase